MGYADLTGKTALVTGAARGIGFAVAKELAEGGANIIIVDLDLDSAKAAAEKISALGVDAMGAAANVADSDAVKALSKQLADSGKNADILVNNAGITRDGLLMKMSDADWNAVIEINLRSVFLMTREFIRPMMKARWGRVVNVASVIGLMGNAGQSNYAASKAGVIGLTKSVAKEFASRNITANAVAPGYIQTEMTAKLSEDVIEKMRQLIPLSRLGDVEDVARSIRFLASEEAGYITGQVLTIDGGMVM